MLNSGEIDAKGTSEVLNSILYLDESVFSRLMKRYDNQVYYEVAVEVYTRMTGRRTLDEMPKPLAHEKDVGVKSGANEFFKVMYPSTKSDDAEEIVGELEAGKQKFMADFSIIRTLKTLIKLSRSPNKKLSEACANLVKDIMELMTKNSYTTTKQMCESLKPKGYYEKELVKAIREVHKNVIARGEN